MAFLSGNKPVPLLFIIVYAVVLWSGQYALRGLWNPDESRYTYVAREMAQYDSPMVPIRNGVPYTHKPPLMFWLIQASTVFTGGAYNGVAGRLPSLLGAVLALWVAARLALLWFGAPTAWRSLFILSTSFLFWKEAGYGRIDMLLLGLEMMALYLLLLNDETPSVRLQAGAFCFMGLAVLAKGPVGLIIPIGIYASVNFFTGKTRSLKKRFWLWGIPLSLAFPGAWLLGAWIQDASPEFFHELLFSQNVGRVTGEFGGHVKPFYYYIQYLLTDFLPWFFFFPLSVAVLKQDPGRRMQLRALLSWMLFVVLFFTAISSKRDIYILSVYPAAAIVVAAAWPDLVRCSGKWLKISVYPLLAAMLVLGIAGLVVPAAVKLPVPGAIFIPVGLVMTAGTALLFNRFKSSGPDRTFFARMSAVFIAAELVAGMIVLPGFNNIKTPVKLARAAEAFHNPPKPLLLYRMDDEILPLYSHLKGRVIESPGQMQAEMNKIRDGIAVFSKEDWEKVKGRFDGLGTSESFCVGSQIYFYLIFHPRGSKSHHLRP